jgi:hypothetical protein
MTTIDELLKGIDAVKARYNRQQLLNFFFEFAYQFVEHTKLPHTQLTYEAIISWKLAGLYHHVKRQYIKDKRMAYQTLNVPPYKCIPATLDYEVKNWNSYWERIAENELKGLK